VITSQRVFVPHLPGEGRQILSELFRLVVPSILLASPSRAPDDGGRHRTSTTSFGSQWAAPTADSMSECVPDRITEYVPECMLDRMSENTSGYLPGRRSDGMSEYMPGGESENVPERMSEYMSEQGPENVSEHVPDRMSEYLPDKMSEIVKTYAR